ncbi:MAG: terminase small subunit [Verrucomicrobiia bacterium]
MNPDTITCGSDQPNQPVPSGDITLAIPRPKRVRLTHRQRVFIAEYVRTWNGAKAARLAGYTHRSAEVMSCKMLKDPKILAEIDAHLKRLHLTPDEVLSRLAAIAGADFADFLDEQGNVDIEKVKAQGELVRSLEQKQHGCKLELHDPQRALETIAKILGMTRDTQPQTGTAIQFNVNVSGDCV